ncbi:peptide transporter PTR2 [Candida tropicalis MYA-3404]|uniref:Peptide transporter PTR2 n=1 Tax=Candida tropicalis (strain ATCC MYA-3404 / T1) TaxID=294747 RepID=C5M480_CANTT|nr:peptide transporter PTR2 [Candida tropicalis MYA-3404]EER36129.1 peptide transporter PTR2 [Candida tropicalis MYA-3404]KAG4410249.1 hypothetical protein JTP64_000887 [Candida tropicalis]
MAHKTEKNTPSDGIPSANSRVTHVTTKQRSHVCKECQKIGQGRGSSQPLTQRTSRSIGVPRWRRTPAVWGVWVNSSSDVVGKNTSRGVVGGTLSKLTKTKDNCAVPDVPNHSSQGSQLVLGWSSQPFGIMLVNKVGGVVFWIFVVVVLFARQAVFTCNHLKEIWSFLVGIFWSSHVVVTCLLRVCHYIEDTRKKQEVW